MFGKVLAVAAATLFMTGTAAAAQGTAAERSPALKRLVDCKAIADPAARLACFEREVSAMDAAEANKQLVIVDQDQVRKAKRSLFGLTLPNLAVFGDDDSGEESATIETTIKRAFMSGDKKWGFELEDGARWVQVDSRNLAVDPKAGHPIRIRKAAMGSYLANVNKQVAIRVRRVQ